MKLLPRARCPVCEGVLPLTRVWSKGSTARGLFLREKTGVACPGCGIRLVILQSRAVVAGFISFCVLCFMGTFALVELDTLMHRRLHDVEVLLVLGVFAVLAGVWQFRVVPLFCRVRVAGHGEPVNYPLTHRR